MSNTNQRRISKKILAATLLPLVSVVFFMWLVYQLNPVLMMPLAPASCDNYLVASSNNHPTVTPIEANLQAESMSAEEIFRYLHWTNSTSCLFAVDFGFWVYSAGGVVAPDGHKAVCLDQFIAPVYDNCLVYSFGINNLWSFDDAMAAYGCQVYSFDPSMGVGDHNRTEKIHFYNIGLSGEDRMDLSRGWNMKTASSIYQMLSNSHGSSTLIDVMKVDIEFSEWDAIPQMLQSGFLADKVKQLAMEIHFNLNDPLETFRQRIRILQDLEAATTSSSTSNRDYGGFSRFSSRSNPWCLQSVSVLGGKKEYTALELAWYNPKYYSS